MIVEPFSFEIEPKGRIEITKEIVEDKLMNVTDKVDLRRYLI